MKSSLLTSATLAAMVGLSSAAAAQHSSPESAVNAVLSVYFSEYRLAELTRDGVDAINPHVSEGVRIGLLGLLSNVEEPLVKDVLTSAPSGAHRELEIRCNGSDILSRCQVELSDDRTRWTDTWLLGHSSMGWRLLDIGYDVLASGHGRHRWLSDITGMHGASSDPQD